LPTLVLITMMLDSAKRNSQIWNSLEL
jgi:hypothetical protein